ncbi:MAG: hypothetical protein KME45_03760 [Stenomitos rutilans HA7619-LM2]|nr:hypothetical protein [Stenomitos rutilans HA7619-LM2]
MPVTNANTAELQAILARSRCADIVLATTCFAAIRQKSSANLPQLKRLNRFRRWGEESEANGQKPVGRSQPCVSLLPIPAPNTPLRRLPIPLAFSFLK